MRASAVIAGAVVSAHRAAKKPAWKQLVEEKAEERSQRAREALELEEAARQRAEAEDAERRGKEFFNGSKESQGGDGEGYAYTLEEVPLAEALQKWELAVRDVRYEPTECCCCLARRMRKACTRT
jgi:hypothetical protein